MRKSNFLIAKLALMMFLAVIFCNLTSVATFASEENAAELCEIVASELTQYEAGTTYVKVKWRGISNAYGYNVYVATSKNGTYKRLDSSKACDVTDKKAVKISSLKAGHTYYVKISIVYKDDDSTYTESSLSTSLEVVTRPEAIKRSNIKQTGASATSVTVQWKASTGATGYKVYLNGVYKKTTKKTKIKLKVSQGSRNTVKIVPIRAASTGYVAAGKATTQYKIKATPYAPSKVANFSSKNISWLPTVSNKITVSWNKNSKNKYTPDGYQVIIYSMAGKKLKVYNTTENTKTFKLSAVKNTGFKIKVRAYIKVNGKKVYGSWSDKKVVVPQAKMKLKRGTRNTLNVSWTKVTKAVKYNIYVCDDVGTDSTAWYKIATVGPGTTSYTIYNRVVGTATAVYVQPVVKYGSKKYKATFMWYLYMNIT